MSLALKRIRKSAVRKGMVLVHKSETPPRGGSPPLRHDRAPMFISALQPCGSSRGRFSSYSERPAVPSVAAQMLISPPSHNTTLQKNYQVRGSPLCCSPLLLITHALIFVLQAMLHCGVRASPPSSSFDVSEALLCPAGARRRCGRPCAS